jgi:ankyrin repeat protein
VELLVTNKADVNARDRYGYTPLHMAAMGHKDIVEFLLLNKADVNAKGIRGDTPLHVAVLSNHDDVAEVLRQHGGGE